MAAARLQLVTNTAATNWNYLPYDIRNCDSVSVFKRKLKSHFSIAHIAYSHMSPPPLRITFYVTYGAL